MIAVEETCCCGAKIQLDDLLTFTERDHHLKGWRERHRACTPPRQWPGLIAGAESFSER